ncbi:putative disease resistance protein At4g10780 [Quercus robur]|uniref:putative disease resistance protein At4g10780 n=1 Tax=Quercus robur TaxID=38942 RepID=UPI0021617B63|nr:putative disease resistance protein At4g10780 [Quercus robur]
MKNRKAEFNNGHAMLNNLENACLLEGGSKDFRTTDILEKRRFVKMHDLIRDMALRIADAKFLVSDYVPNEEEWGNDVEKVSLMCKRGSKFPNVSPKCPKLSTLLLRGYVNIIPDSFFVHLHGLRVLHVDCLEFESLPNSVSDLKHLTSLRLINSFHIRRVPSLAKLTALRSLDLSGGSLEEIPHGLEMLVNLRYLNVDSYNMNHKMMPPGILPKLCQLQVLKLPFSGLEVNGERRCLEILLLYELNNLKGLFREEKVAPAPVVPLGTFSRLKQFSICDCPNIKKLFTPGSSMQNLEQIKVYGCEQLEGIIGGAEASDDEVEEEEAEKIVEIFPQLRKLTLQYLLELKTICSCSNVILCDSLDFIMIEDCPKLNRLPLSLHLIDGELSSPPPSLQIYIEKERWELLEWDNHDMKMVLEPLCQFI